MEACGNGICIRVKPRSLTCTPDGCGPVTIESIGSRPPHIRTIEFDGEAATQFDHDGECQDKQLRPNDACTLTLTFRPSSAGDLCAQGFVWREAVEGDHVCVEPSFRDEQVASDNAAARGRHEPGSDTCLTSFVWREATPSDHVCVYPNIRAQVADQNADPTAYRATDNGTRRARLIIHQNLPGPPTYVALTGER